MKMGPKSCHPTVTADHHPMAIPDPDTVEVTALSNRAVYLAIKRATDVALVLILGVVALPLMFLLFVLVKLASRGPVIYSQVRVGQNRRPFLIHKIRTMYHDCERLSGPKWSTDNDPRVTPVGRYLRRTHLDELPQLWNILVGDMSLVGPWPERPEFVVELEKALPRYAERLDVPPGLTGLAQVNLPPDIDHDSVRRKLAFDLYYTRAIGAWLDLRILAGTALMVLGVTPDMLARLLNLRPGSLLRIAADPGQRVREREPVGVVEIVPQGRPAWRES
jgi:lipopolysaccharide/colanic/teichoic acid biosynthesis glycosyltransferase